MFKKLTLYLIRFELNNNIEYLLVSEESLGKAIDKITDRHPEAKNFSDNTIGFTTIETKIN